MFSPEANDRDIAERADRTNARVVDDLDDPLRLGDLSGELTPARYIGDAPTLVRLYSGRPVPDGTGYELAGAEPAELNIFGG